MIAFADHFSQLAARYAQYRPHYPPALVDALAAASLAHGVVWDIGCGNGQLSVALAARFDRVIATDPAQAQLDHAERHPRVEYRCEPAEASSLPDASVDLAVAAQAAHWFDWPRFVPEVGRVVRPGGLIGLVTYFNAELDGEAGALLAAFYADIAPHWPGGRTHVNNRYRDLVLPWPAVEPPAIDPTGGSAPRLAGGAVGAPTPRLASLDLTAQWTRDELFGYVTTWSATARMVAAGGGARLERLGRELTERWPGNEPREIRWPLTIKLARR